jgi:hypothetical protein
MNEPDLEKEAAAARLALLLRWGYLPAELPPTFSSETFAESAIYFANKWDNKKIREQFNTAPESYSIPRYGDTRRKLSIVNPINQLEISRIISDNWIEIQTRLKRSTISEFVSELTLSKFGRSISSIDFDSVSRNRARLLSTYGGYIKTDIARFYPSIYTHSIPWAVLGKAYVKSNRHTPSFKNHFANHLDQAVGAGQEGQTMGIPIGPDTSRILAELIAVEVEEIAKSYIPDLGDRGIRYVDDMLIGLNENDSPSSFLSGLSIALYDYQLELNAGKTENFGIRSPQTPEWVHYIRDFELNKKLSHQRGEIDSFFQNAIYLAEKNKSDNVILYAVKRAASFDVSNENISHLVRWLLYVARRSANSLSFIAEYLAVLSKNTFLPDSEIKAYIIQQIPIKAASGHTEELAWLLFWAREIRLMIPTSAMENVMNLRSSVVGLITLDLWHRKQIDGVLDFSFWQTFASIEGLKSEMWLIAYEATRKSWWPQLQDSSFITQHDFFADLWNRNVSFYDAGRNARRGVTTSFTGMNFEPGALSSY